MSESSDTDKNKDKSKSKGKYAKWAGVGAFLFFLIKGIGWLVVIWLGIDLFKGC